MKLTVMPPLFEIPFLLTIDVLHHLGFQRRVRRARGARTSMGDEARARWQRATGVPGAGAIRQGPGQVLRGFEWERRVYTATHGMWLELLVRSKSGNTAEYSDPASGHD